MKAPLPANPRRGFEARPIFYIGSKLADRLRSAGSAICCENTVFHAKTRFFDVEEREEVPMRHELLLGKVSVGCAALHPSYGSFHGSRVTQRDMKYCGRTDLGSGCSVC